MLVYFIISGNTGVNIALVCVCEKIGVFASYIGVCVRNVGVCVSNVGVCVSNVGFAASCGVALCGFCMFCE